MHPLIHLGLVVTALVATPAAHAAPLFDPPQKIIVLPATTAADQRTCTVYPDVIIRQDGTDQPAIELTTLIPRTPHTPATCPRATPPGAIALPTQATYLLGRKSRFLIFDDADPNGAAPFEILDLPTNRILFTDSHVADVRLPPWIQTLSLTHATLHMRYRRAFNADCSLLTGGNTCWSHLLQTNQIPPNAHLTPPPPSICQPAYRTTFEKPDDTDPSLIAYTATLTLTSTGDAKATASSPIACDPLP